MTLIDAKLKAWTKVKFEVNCFDNIPLFYENMLHAVFILMIDAYKYNESLECHIFGYM